MRGARDILLYTVYCGTGVNRGLQIITHPSMKHFLRKRFTLSQRRIPPAGMGLNNPKYTIALRRRAVEQDRNVANADGQWHANIQVIEII
jgi:hypothetical protein